MGIRMGPAFLARLANALPTLLVAFAVPMIAPLAWISKAVIRLAVDTAIPVSPTFSFPNHFTNLRNLEMSYSCACLPSSNSFCMTVLSLASLRATILSSKLRNSSGSSVSSLNSTVLLIVS